MTSAREWPRGGKADVRTTQSPAHASSVSSAFASFSRLPCGPQLLLQPIDIDRLGEELGGPQFAGSAAPLVVTVGGYDHHRELGEPLLDLARQVQPVHPRHVDVRQNDDQLRLDPSPSSWSAPSAEFAKCIT